MSESIVTKNITAFSVPSPIQLYTPGVYERGEARDYIVVLENKHFAHSILLQRNARNLICRFNSISFVSVSNFSSISLCKCVVEVAGVVYSV